MTVVHIHHGLRGESADADENYVRALCEKLDVELLAFHEDVGRYAKEQKLTLEEAGRNVRRHIFEEVCHRKTERGSRWRIIRMTMRRHFCGI